MTFGMLADTRLGLVVTGPGLVNTTQSLTAMVEVEAPMMILMVGCAGGFQQAGMRLGDIGVATAEIDVQLGIESSDGKGVLPLPFDLGELAGEPIKNRVEINDGLSAFAEKLICRRFEKEQVTVMRGNFITVSTITATDQRAMRLYEQFHPCMESMEGVAGAYLAGYYGLPFLEIRSASNLVGNRQREAWDLPLACQRSGLAAESVLGRIKERLAS